MNITAVSKADGSVVLTAKQGATWNFPLGRFQDAAMTVPEDLTGKLARGQIRKAVDSATAVKTFTCVIPAVTTGAIALTISASSFTRATGSFIADGFQAGDIIVCNSSLGNNKKALVISILTATTLTLATPLGATPTLTSEAANLTITTAGTIRVSLSASDSAAIPCGRKPADSASAYVFDIETYSGAPEVVDRVLQGTILIDAEVTR